MVQMSVLDRLFRCCCGGGQEEADSGVPYERLDATVPVRDRNFGQNNFRDSASDLRDLSPPHSSLNDSQSNLPQRSKREQEEEALNAIIDNTQSNIIDVTHLDTSEVNSTEFTARQRKYEDAVRQHDSRVAKGSPASTGSKVPGSTLGMTGQLLDDAGNRTTDWLGRPALSRESIAASETAAARVAAVVDESLVIKTTRPLIVHMDT
ncbi:hypothetical protein PMAYCL1PPCAC_28568 [Pristionchus mayeri]|uniref:Ragulator complex protein LAMTOR1 n=1 Tax=Pristionchus mayeri TaxID=1317129 RepID=A0AAN5D8C5_9BILA|nr:hypothetical protein PMAYCL1PPCAC_28568 [Pristionchus mayeri]